MRCKPHSCGQLAAGATGADELRDCVHLTHLLAARRLSELAVSGACGGANDRSAGRFQRLYGGDGDRGAAGRDPGPRRSALPGGLASVDAVGSIGLVGERRPAGRRAARGSWARGG